MVKEEINLELLSRYLDEDLPEEEQKKVERLVAHSPEARRQLEAMRRMLETLGRLPDHGPPPGFMERLEQRLPPKKIRLKDWLTLGFLPVPVRALAVVLIITAGSIIALRSQKDTGRLESLLSTDEGVSITREDSALREQKTVEEPPAAPALGLGYTRGIEKSGAARSLEPESLADSAPVEDAWFYQKEQMKESVKAEQDPAMPGMPGIGAPRQEMRGKRDEILSRQRAAPQREEFSHSAPQVAPQEQQILLESARRADPDARIESNNIDSKGVGKALSTPGREDSRDLEYSEESAERMPAAAAQSTVPASPPATGRDEDLDAFGSDASAEVITIRSATPAEMFSKVSEWLKKEGKTLERDSSDNQEGSYQLVFLTTPEEARAIRQKKADFFQGNDFFPVASTMSEGDIHQAREEKDQDRYMMYDSVSESSATELVRWATSHYSRQVTPLAFGLADTASVPLEKVILIFKPFQ